MTIYRRIWEQHNNQKIPKDNQGRSYEIHHIDGNHDNNHPSNLQLVTIEEHYKIHYNQGDWYACLMMSKRMKMSPEEISELATKNVQKQLSDGTHPFLGGEIQKITNAKRISEGTHNFLDSEFKRKQAAIQLSNGTHPLQNSNLKRKYSAIQLANGTHVSQKKMICPHCNHEGRGGGMKRWHFEKCSSR